MNTLARDLTADQRWVSVDEGDAPALPYATFDAPAGSTQVYEYRDLRRTSSSTSVDAVVGGGAAEGVDEGVPRERVHAVRFGELDRVGGDVDRGDPARPVRDAGACVELAQRVAA